MLLVWALLLAVWVPQGTSPARWTYNLKCHHCSTINTFFCPQIRVCPAHLRRCMTVSAHSHVDPEPGSLTEILQRLTGLNPRELLVYKNCTSNCTFLYPDEVPPEAPRSKFFKTNSFYFVRCCSSINCNEGGPHSVEQDIVPDYVTEAHIGAAARWEAAVLLSLASLLVGHALTCGALLEGPISPLIPQSKFTLLSSLVSHGH